MIPFVVEGIYFGVLFLGGNLMNTSILTVVLASALLAGQNGTPTWQNDYSKAQKQGSAQKKPLLVLFGSGANGWAKVVREAPPAADVTKLMADQYVCVYVDTASPAGKKLAQDFGINGTMGVVISDRDGTSQAFWHQGDMTNQNLARLLQKYSDPKVSVRTTETAGNTSRTSLYPPSASESSWEGIGTGSSYCPSCNGGGRRR
jgi:hypothetical protein